MAANLDTLRHRARIVAAIRHFFASRDFLEVETPYLVSSPGMEPHLNAFRTDFISENRQDRILRYLPTSPEFHMKRLLCQGADRIFQLARSFRNGEIGDLHQPEFCMLEWYRAHADYLAIMDDVEEVITAAAREVHGEPVLSYRGRIIDLARPWHRITVADVWRRFADIDLVKFSSAEALRCAGRAAAVPNLREDDSWDILYFKIFLDRIERNLGWDRPVILYEYPAGMAALARLKPGNPTVALRFELYIAGIELANAFDELTDPEIQLERCMESRKIQIESGAEPFPLDMEFIDALRQGMPPSAGIALGLDRLIMLLLGKNSIGDVIAFPFDRN
ncbi:EF-P lysine aminoacylase GenX [bacterium]|nr:EF-P lysine aminoacylase GenX [candidate division CSSED10-310 bacterium]